jgi:hypothetical protein
MIEDRRDYAIVILDYVETNELINYTQDHDVPG